MSGEGGIATCPKCGRTIHMTNPLHGTCSRHGHIEARWVGGTDRPTVDAQWTDKLPDKGGD